MDLPSFDFVIPIGRRLKGCSGGEEGRERRKKKGEKKAELGL